MTKPTEAGATPWTDLANLRALFEQSPFSSVIYDLAGHPLALNPAFTRLWGVGMETVPPGYSVLRDPELERNGLLPYIRRAFTGETLAVPALRYDIARVSETGKGRAVWVEGHFFPIRDPGGTLQFIVLVHIDVTQRHEAVEALRESEERIRLAQRAAHIGVFDWHVPSGRVTWSEEEERIFGLAPGTFEGTIEGWGARVLAEDLARMQRDMGAAMERKEREMEFAFRIRRPDGDVRQIEGRASFFYAEDGAPLRMVGVNVDVTDRDRMDAALRDSQARLDETEQRTRALLESVTDPLVAYDRSWTIVYLNDPARLFFREAGFEGDPLNRVLWEIVPQLRETPLYREMLAAMTRGEPVTFETPRASTGWLEVRTYPMAEGLVAYWTDVSARNRARARAELLAAGSATLTEHVDVEAALQALMRLLAREYADYVAVHLVDELEGDRLLGVAHRDPEREHAVRGEQGLEALRRQFPSIAAPLRARGRVLGALTVVSADPSRAYDEEDRSFVEELARRAGLAIDNARLFLEAQRARESAEQASRAKTQFLATMSHELRTPLNAISGYASLIEMGVRGPITPEQRQDLERIQRSQRHLTAIINEILDYARIEAGSLPLNRRPTPVHAAIASAVALIEPQRLGRDLTVAIDVPDESLTVLADAEKLQQVLLNLLSNALKFTPAQGTITIRAESVGDIGDRVAIRVRDTGIGIPRDKLQSIFEPFVQVGRALNNPGEGTGLGLAISRDLARAMAGDLTADSAPGEWSEFTLTLPSA